VIFDETLARIRRGVAAPMRCSTVAIVIKISVGDDPRLPVGLSTGNLT
jgi:hypothetical protein